MVALGVSNDILAMLSPEGEQVAFGRVLKVRFCGRKGWQTGSLVGAFTLGQVAVLPMFPARKVNSESLGSLHSRCICGLLPRRFALPFKLRTANALLIRNQSASSYKISQLSPQHVTRTCPVSCPLGAWLG
jgi:hypothetical protein